MSDTFDPMTGRYTGSPIGFFLLVMQTSLLTVLTLGLYRFWARTRVRRYVWSATSPGGDPFEYTGTGLEKLLGFLFAIVVLAVFLGLMQLILFYFGLSLFASDLSEQEMAVRLSFAYSSVFFIAPLIWIARYRARRYKLSRTRWRGLRFGMEPGAFSFMIKAVGHSFVTGITFGLLLPRQTWYLAKYQMDRTWYGDAKFQMEGGWFYLFPAMKHSLLGVAIMAISLVLMGVVTPVFGIGIGVGYVWLLIGIVHYKVQSYITILENSTLGADVRFGAVPSTAEIVMKVLSGLILTGVVGALLSGALIALSAMTLGIDPAALQAGERFEIAPIGAVVTALSGLVIAVLFGALVKVFLTQPITRIIVEQTAVLNPEGLDEIRQRAEQDQVDADGLADALDVGGAF